MSNEIVGYTDLGDLHPDPVATVETETSLWLIDAGGYVRLPKTEAPDPGRARWSDWGRLDDFVRHEHHRAYWATDERGYLRVRIRPVAGPPDGYGIHTGIVVAVSGLNPDDPLRALAALVGDDAA